MASLWMKNGKVVVDAGGHPIICATCPCPGAVPCPSDCSGCAASIAFAVAFTAPYNVYNYSDTAPGGGVGCTWSKTSIIPPNAAIFSIFCSGGCWFMELDGTIEVPGSSPPVSKNVNYESAGFGCGDACPPAGARTLAPKVGSDDIGSITITI